MTIQDKEELIVMVVLVLVILTLHDTEADNCVIDLAQRLVVPPVGALLDEIRNIDDRKRRKLDVEEGCVGMS